VQMAFCAIQLGGDIRLEYSFQNGSQICCIKKLLHCRGFPFSTGEGTWSFVRLSTVTLSYHRNVREGLLRSNKTGLRILNSQFRRKETFELQRGGPPTTRVEGFEYIAYRYEIIQHEAKRYYVPRGFQVRVHPQLIQQIQPFSN
jgi:hypothetical protein